MKKRNLLTLMLSVALLGVNLNVNAMQKRTQPDHPSGQSGRQEKRARADEEKKEEANVLKSAGRKIGKAVQPTIDFIRRKKKQEAEEKVKQIQGRISGLSSKLATPVHIQRPDPTPKTRIHPGPPGPPPHRPTIPTPRDVPGRIHQRQAPQGLFQMIEHILSMNPSEISYDHERLLHDHPEIVQQIKRQKLFRSVESALSIPQHERSCEAERFLDDHSDIVDHMRRQQHERMERDRRAHFYAQQRRRSIAEDRIRVALKKSWHSSDDCRLFDEFPDFD